MEFEYFIHPENWEAEFETLLNEIRHWYREKMCFKAENIVEHEISTADRAHYSKRTVDFEYAYPIGVKEIGGFAYRTDFDLKNHQEMSGKSMEYTIKGTNQKFIPHVLEPTFGIDRHVLAVLCEAYSQDEVNGERRVFLRIPFHLAPIKVAVAPLLRNKPELVTKAREVYAIMKQEFGAVLWDDNGNIGKRYRRQDEIGTPYFVTIDFDTISDNTVTLRNRDTTQQSRVKIEELALIIRG
jgi:glycyl-tRNA synthetase